MGRSVISLGSILASVRIVSGYLHVFVGIVNLICGMILMSRSRRDNSIDAGLNVLLGFSNTGIGAFIITVYFSRREECKSTQDYVYKARIMWSLLVHSALINCLCIAVMIYDTPFSTRVLAQSRASGVWKVLQAHVHTIAQACILLLMLIVLLAISSFSIDTLTHILTPDSISSSFYPLRRDDYHLVPMTDRTRVFYNGFRTPTETTPFSRTLKIGRPTYLTPNMLPHEETFCDYGYRSATFPTPNNSGGGTRFIRSPTDGVSLEINFPGQRTPWRRKTPRKETTVRRNVFANYTEHPSEDLRVNRSVQCDTSDISQSKFGSRIPPPPPAPPMGSSVGLTGSRASTPHSAASSIDADSLHGQLLEEIRQHYIRRGKPTTQSGLLLTEETDLSRGSFRK